MGAIIGAALVSHVPTLVLPEADRRAMNHGDDTTLFAGLHQIRAEKFAPLDIDTVVVIGGHAAGLFVGSVWPSGAWKTPLGSVAPDASRPSQAICWVPSDMCPW